MGKRKRVLNNKKLKKLEGGEGTDNTSTAALVHVSGTLTASKDRSEDVSTSEEKNCEEVKPGASLNNNNSNPLQNEREDMLNESEMNSFPRKRGIRSKKLRKVNEAEKAAEVETASLCGSDATEAARKSINEASSYGEFTEKSHTVEADDANVTTKVISSGESMEKYPTAEADDANLSNFISSDEFVDKSPTVEADDANLTKVISSSESVEKSHIVEADDVNAAKNISLGEFVEKSYTVEVDDVNVTEAVAKMENKEMHSGENGIAGFIFMCSEKTKCDCYRFRVFGLPAGKLEIVKKIRKGTKLYLFDFNLKILYGIYTAIGEGDKGLEPNAFGGAFPAQVKFEICKECIPLPERVFKQAIKVNYWGNKFNPELNHEQVRKLSALFQQIPSPQRALSPPPLGTSQHLESQIAPRTGLPPPDGTGQHFAQSHILRSYVAGVPLRRRGSPLLSTNQHVEPHIAPQTGLPPLDGAGQHFSQSHLPHPYVAGAPVGRTGSSSLGTNQHLELQIAPQTGLPPLDGAEQHFAQSHLPHSYVAGAPLGRVRSSFMGTSQHLEPRIAPQTGLPPLDVAGQHFAQSHLPQPYVAGAPLGRAGIQIMPEGRRPVHPYVSAANLASSRRFEPRHIVIRDHGTLQHDPYHRYGTEVSQIGARGYTVAVAEGLRHQAYAGGRGSEMIIPRNGQPQVGFQVPLYDNSSLQYPSTGLAAQSSINMNSTQSRGPDPSLNYYTGAAPWYQSR